MKLLLIQPPVQDFYDTDIRLQPIGLAYLKAAVNSLLPHIEVKIRDFHQGWGRRSVPLPRELSYLRSFYAWPDRSPFSSFYHYYHFGASFETIVEEAAREKPDLVGISSLFSPYYREVLAVAAAVKSRLNVPVLLGGSHVSAMPEEMLAHKDIDFVIRGEGERPLVEFLECFEKGGGFENVPNLGYKKDGKIILNPLQDNYPIQDLPPACLDDLDQDNYLFEKKPLTFVITSRSCPHKCSFCSVHKTFGFEYRRRRVAQVLEEIEMRYAQGYRVFDFEDDNLTYYRKEMKELCRGLIRRFGGKDVQFLAMNGISYLSLDDELLELMKEAGFTHLNLALVSSDITVRETTKRPHTIEKYLSVVRRSRELGFQITSYQILGLPNESLDSMVQTLVFGAAQPVLLGASMFYLTPDSPIAREMNFRHSADDVFKSRLTAMAIEGRDFCRDDLYTLFVTTRIINFIKAADSQGDIGFEDALALLKGGDVRMRDGVLLLEKLFDEKRLYAMTGDGLQELPRFKADLFERIWQRLEFIQTRSGGRVMNRRVPEKTTGGAALAGGSVL